MMELIRGVSETDSQLEAAIAFLFQFVGLGESESPLAAVPRWALATLAFGALLIAGVATVAGAGLPAVELSDVVMCFHTFTGP